MWCGGGLGEVERVDYKRTNFCMPPFVKFSDYNYAEWRNIQNEGEEDKAEDLSSGEDDSTSYESGGNEEDENYSY